VDLPEPEGPTTATVLPAGMVEADVFEDRSIALIGKRHPIKHHIGRTLQGQGLCTWRIGHFAFPVHQHKHFVQVGQALLDLAVQHTQKVQRNVQLDHEGIDHDQIAQGHAPGHHALVARHSMVTKAAAMMSCCPVLSTDKEVCDLSRAKRRRSRLSS
jgi:hypothetical protein